MFSDDENEHLRSASSSSISVPSNSNLLEQALPPAAPDYSSLVAASERQPTLCFPSDSYIVSCDSGVARHSDKNGGGYEDSSEAHVHSLSAADEHVKE